MNIKFYTLILFGLCGWWALTGSTFAEPNIQAIPPQSMHFSLPQLRPKEPKGFCIPVDPSLSTLINNKLFTSASEFLIDLGGEGLKNLSYSELKIAQIIATLNKLLLNFTGEQVKKSKKIQ
jgi:hypothetical protein